MLLDDGTKITFLKPGETYKFMGIHQSNKTDVSNLELKLSNIVEQRSHIVWSSNLSDYNKILASNIFVNSSLQYYFWSCKFRIDFLKDMDRSIRNVMNVCGSKHTNIMNDIIYLPRHKGGRGLRSIENMYKEIKIKSAIKVKLDSDPRMKIVNKFHQMHLVTNSYSLFKEAKKYCSEKHLEMQCDNEIISISGSENTLTSSDGNIISKIKVTLKRLYEMELVNNIVSSTWQGIIMKIRMQDEFIISGFYSWLTYWKSCPTSTISEVMLLISQTLSTKCYLKYRSKDDQMDTKCRLCHIGEESVKHLLSNCGELVKKMYLDRHDYALKCFFFPMLVKLGLICKSPFWYSAEKVKPCCENENYIVYWDMPEYRGTGTSS